jgi:hypothetical protein
LGRKPSNINLEEGKPLDTRAVRAAQGPGIQTIFVPLDLASFTRSSPGSQILGIPASLTRATDLPELRSLIILGILVKELCLLKLIRLFLNSNLFIIFFVCLVSSQAIRETFFKICIALEDKSLKFPMGVPTIYKTLLSGSGFL